MTVHIYHIRRQGSFFRNDDLAHLSLEIHDQISECRRKITDPIFVNFFCYICKLHVIKSSRGVFVGWGEED